MQPRKVFLMLVIALATELVWAQKSPKSSQPDWDAVDASTKGVASYAPKSGMVPDETTAIRVAEAILIPIYGEKKVISERPYYARLSNGTWTVAGSIHTANFGGVAVVKISQVDARIIFVIHEM